jgi:hypothetical protein
MVGVLIFDHSFMEPIIAHPSVDAGMNSIGGQGCAAVGATLSLC